MYGIALSHPLASFTTYRRPNVKLRQLEIWSSSKDRAFFFKVKEWYHDRLSSYVLLSAIFGDSMDRLRDSYPYINKLRNLQQRPRGRVVNDACPQCERFRVRVTLSTHNISLFRYFFKEIWNKKVFIYYKHSYLPLVLNSFDWIQSLKTMFTLSPPIYKHCKYVS